MSLCLRRVILCTHPNLFINAGRESVRASARRLVSFKRRDVKAELRPVSGSSVCLTGLPHSPPLLLFLPLAVQPLRDALSHWSEEPTNQQAARLARGGRKTLPRTRAVCTQQSEAVRICCTSSVVRWTVTRPVACVSKTDEEKAGERYYFIFYSLRKWFEQYKHVVVRVGGGTVRCAAGLTDGDVHTCSRTEPRHTFLQPASAHCSREVYHVLCAISPVFCVHMVWSSVFHPRTLFLWCR